MRPPGGAAEPAASGITLALLDLQRQQLAELQRIRQLLEQQRRPSHLTRGDRDKLTRILPAIAGALGSELFTARELLDQDAPALRLVLADLNARQVGRLLQRAEGENLEGFTVHRDGSEVGAVLWRVLAVA